MAARARPGAAPVLAVASGDGDDESDLVYTTDRDPGISRGGTRRPTYRHPDGRRVTDEATLARIRALAVPPAWTDVWICPDPDGHLQATGRDQKGRKQSRYHPRFRSEREDLKFSQLVEFGVALPRIRRRVAADIAQRTPNEHRQTALVVHLLDLTALRVGNERYVRENRSFGLSTLRGRQVHVEGSEITFSFVGKGGRRHRVRLHDRRLARLVAQCQDLPGQTLFTYLDDDGVARPVGSHHVNAYLREASGAAFTAKTFRTWTGTTEAARLLAATREPPTKRALLEAFDGTAALLGNTRSVCRASYVHPAVERRYLDGTLGDIWRSGPSRPAAALTTAERRTLHLLRVDAAGEVPAAAAS